MALQDLGNTFTSRKTSTIVNVVDWEDGTGLLAGDTFALCTLPAGAVVVGIKAYALEAVTSGDADDHDLAIGVTGALESLFLSASAEVESTGPVAGVEGVDFLEVISTTDETVILGSIINSTDAGVAALTAGTIRIAVTIAERMNG